MSASDAAQIAAALGDALQEALKDAQAESTALSRLDHASVLQFAIRRERFNTESKDLARQLQQAIAGRDPKEVPGLPIPLAAIHSLSTRLTRQDIENQRLAERALRFTQAVVNVIRPRPQTYDRRGKVQAVRPETNSPSTVSHHT